MSQSQTMTAERSTGVDLVLWVQLDPKEAADHITSLKARIQELEGALRPFAMVAEAYNEAHLNRVRASREENRLDPNPLPDGHRVSVSMGELRAALKVLP